MKFKLVLTCRGDELPKTYLSSGEWSLRSDQPNIKVFDDHTVAIAYISRHRLNNGLMGRRVLVDPIWEPADTIIPR